jgi:hypothetical protein
LRLTTILLNIRYRPNTAQKLPAPGSGQPCMAEGLYQVESLKSVSGTDRFLALLLR